MSATKATSSILHSLKIASATLTVAAAALAVFAACAGAAPAPSWSIESSPLATYFRPGNVGAYTVVATNVGTASVGTETEPVTITDTLPAGLTATSVELYAPGFPGFDVGPFICTTAPVRCEYPGFLVELGAGPIEPGQQLKMVVHVTVAMSAPEGPIVNEATVEGGGARASTSSRNTISSHPPFGVEKFALQTTRMKTVPVGPNEYESGEPYTFTQAAGHPWALTSTVKLDNEAKNGNVYPTRDPKDIVVNLPPGLLGNPNPQSFPRCSLTQVFTRGLRCPHDTQIGEARLHWEGGSDETGPIVNLTPEAGQSAEFGLENLQDVTPILTAHLVHTLNPHTGKDEYGFAVVSNGIPTVDLVEVETIFWGVPAEQSHDSQRGLFCQGQVSSCSGGGAKSGSPEVPFLFMPTACSAGPETATMRADSWQEPGEVGVNGQYSSQYKEASTTMPGVTGCNLLAFNPSIVTEPDTPLADAPVGLGVNVQVPQNLNPASPATPTLRDAVVTLPLGMSVSPGVVDGIQACQATGPEGINIEGPESEQKGSNGEWQLAPGKCPDASIVGTAEATTPLLPEPVKGHVYLARPGCGGAGQSACTDQDALDGNLYKLYLELGGVGALGNTGIEIKVQGNVDVNPATGQITTKFLENPQTPFSELKIHLNGGPRAPLDTPATCGSATTTADFTPWSAPGTTPEGVFMPGLGDATPSSFFEVSGCSSPPGLKPGFTAGTVTPNAAKFSSFTMNLSRQDREQFVKGIQVHTPPGLLAMLSSVPLCPEAQANDPAVYGECAASKIGTTRVASGAGSHPFEIEGNVYLTGPHDGAPFGLSVVTHAVAGPFNLGLVVVRARINIDPTDSTATITTDETGPYALPQIIFGVPLRLKQITVNIDRPGFMFSPTNCKGQQVTARISGSENAVANVSSPFAAAGCRSLAFQPKFQVTTSGRTSKRAGASLDAKVSYPAGSMGSEANIAYVKVDLPKQLPSRLTTLQKACLAAVFNANPANCPPASIVGIARTTTPVLPVGLEGPVYFVSHGGEAFPSLIVALQGDGVRVDLTGTTFISKAGITSSTFKTVPDVPVSTFELYLPEGKFSALAANGNLCKPTTTRTVRKKVVLKRHGKAVRRRGKVVKVTRKVKQTAPASLAMPTEFVAQNGAVIHRSTQIKVTGCTKPKKKAKKSGRAGK